MKSPLSRQNGEGGDDLVYDPHRIETRYVVGPFGDGFRAGDYPTARRFFLYARNQALDAALENPVLMVHVATDVPGHWEVWASPLSWSSFRDLLTTAWAQGFELNPFAYMVEQEQLIGAVHRLSLNNETDRRRRKCRSAYRKLVAAAFVISGDMDASSPEFGRNTGTTTPEANDGRRRRKSLRRVVRMINEIGHTLAQVHQVSHPEVPQADQNGWFNARVEGTIRIGRSRRGWTDLLKTSPPPGLPHIHKEAVLKGLGAKSGMDGRDRVGRYTPGAFYSIDIVRETFPNHFALVDYQADANGFFVDLRGHHRAAIPTWVDWLIEVGRAPKYWHNKPYETPVARFLRRYCEAGDGIDSRGLVQRGIYYTQMDAEFAMSVWDAMSKPAELLLKAGLMLCGSESVWQRYFAEMEDLPDISLYQISERMRQARANHRFHGRAVDRGNSSVYGLALVLEVFSREIAQHRVRTKDGSYSHCNPVTGVVETYAPLLWWVEIIRTRFGVDTNPRRLRRQLDPLNVKDQVLTLPIEGAFRPVPLWPESVIFRCRIVTDAIPLCDRA